MPRLHMSWAPHHPPLLSGDLIFFGGVEGGPGDLPVWGGADEEHPPYPALAGSFTRPVSPGTRGTHRSNLAARKGSKGSVSPSSYARGNPFQRRLLRSRRGSSSHAGGPLQNQFAVERPPSQSSAPLKPSSSTRGKGGGSARPGLSPWPPSSLQHRPTGRALEVACQKDRYASGLRGSLTGIPPHRRRPVRPVSRQFVFLEGDACSIKEGGGGGLSRA